MTAFGIINVTHYSNITKTCQSVRIVGAGTNIALTNTAMPTPLMVETGRTTAAQNVDVKPRCAIMKSVVK